MSLFASRTEASIEKIRSKFPVVALKVAKSKVCRFQARPPQAFSNFMALVIRISAGNTRQAKHTPYSPNSFSSLSCSLNCEKYVICWKTCLFRNDCYTFAKAVADY